MEDARHQFSSAVSGGSARLFQAVEVKSHLRLTPLIPYTP